MMLMLSCLPNNKRDSIISSINVSYNGWLTIRVLFSSSYGVKMFAVMKNAHTGKDR